MAEIYRYKGKLYVIRKPGERGFPYTEERVYCIAKNGTERKTNWMGDVIRTLGQGVTGWNGENDCNLPSRLNGRPLAAHAASH